MDVVPDSFRQVSRHFGVQLDELLVNATAANATAAVPRVVVFLCESLIVHGAAVPDVLGSAKTAADVDVSHMARVKDLLNHGKFYDCGDSSVLCALLKAFLRELPSSLFPAAFYTEAMNLVVQHISESEMALSRSPHFRALQQKIGGKRYMDLAIVPPSGVDSRLFMAAVEAHAFSLRRQDDAVTEIFFSLPHAHRQCLEYLSVFFSKATSAWRGAAPLDDVADAFAPYILRPAIWGSKSPSERAKQRFLRSKFLLLLLFFVKKKHNLLSAVEREGLDNVLSPDDEVSSIMSEILAGSIPADVAHERRTSDFVAPPHGHRFPDSDYIEVALADAADDAVPLPLLEPASGPPVSLVGRVAVPGDDGSFVGAWVREVSAGVAPELMAMGLQTPDPPPSDESTHHTTTDDVAPSAGLLSLVLGHPSSRVKHPLRSPALVRLPKFGAVDTDDEMLVPESSVRRRSSARPPLPPTTEQAHLPTNYDRAVAFPRSFLQHDTSDSQPLALRLKPPPPHDAVLCTECQKPLGPLFPGRRACRYCGRMFCRACCSMEMTVPWMVVAHGDLDAQHVCAECSDHLNRCVSLPVLRLDLFADEAVKAIGHQRFDTLKSLVQSLRQSIGVLGAVPCPSRQFLLSLVNGRLVPLLDLRLSMGTVLQLKSGRLLGQLGWCDAVFSRHVGSCLTCMSVVASSTATWERDPRPAPADDTEDAGDEDRSLAFLRPLPASIPGPLGLVPGASPSPRTTVVGLASLIEDYREMAAEFEDDLNVLMEMSY